MAPDLVGGFMLHLAEHMGRSSLVRLVTGSIQVLVTMLQNSFAPIISWAVFSVTILFSLVLNLVPGKPVQPSLMLLGKATSLP